LTLLAINLHPRVVMKIVEHSVIEMTMNVYGHVNPETAAAGPRPPR
jgi:integrase